MDSLKALIDLDDFKKQLLKAANQRAAKITSSLLGGGFRYREVKKFKLEYVQNEIIACSDFGGLTYPRYYPFIAGGLIMKPRKRP